MPSASVTAVTVTLSPLASVMIRVTVRPGPTSEVPLMGALATLPPFTSSRLTVMFAVVSTLPSSLDVPLLPAGSVTLAVTS
ncbi:hypothetical protein D3C78_1443920 [compost metagenome]